MGCLRRGLLPHVLGGIVLAVLASSFVGFGGYFFIDEAALYGQLEVMEERGAWTIERPFPERDPAAQHVPMARSDIADDRFAPFAKHPVHVVLARAFHIAGGEVGVRLLSSLALVAAAVTSATLAGGGTARRATAFWVTVVASPLLFDAQLVVAHTVGAAVAGALLVVLLRARPTAPVLLAAAGLSCLGGLLRNESLLLSGAAGCVLAVRAIRHRSGHDAAAAAAVVGGAAAAYLAEPMLVRWAIGGEPGLERAPTAGSEVWDVVRAAGRSLFELQGSAATPPALVGVAVCASLVGFAAWVAARRRPDPVLLRVSAAGALGGALVFAWHPHLVTGLLWAFPALLLLVAPAGPGVRLDGVMRPPLAIAGVFTVFVAATQYEQGGGLEWGWRYVAIAVPLVTPAIAAVASQLWQRAGLPRTALVAVGLACIVVQVGGLRVQRSAVAETASFLDRVEAVTREADADWVVSLDASFGRFAYDLSTSADVLTAPDGTGSRVLRWLDRPPTSSVLLVWRSDEGAPIDRLGGFRTTRRRWALGGGYQAELLDRR